MRAWMLLWLAGILLFLAPTSLGINTALAAPGEPDAPPAAEAPPPAPDAPPPATEPPAAAEPPDLSGAPVAVNIGTYINRVTGISLKDGTVIADFWLWFRWRGGPSDFDPAQTFEIINGTILSREGSERRPLPNGEEYSAVRVVVQLNFIFDVRTFPLDDHTLNLEIEDTNYEDEEMKYVPDIAYAALDPSARVSGWELSGGSADVITWEYRTNYGDLSLGDKPVSHYTRYRYPLILTRSGVGMYFKLFWGSYVAVFLALSALLIKVTDLDARFGLGVGSLFAAMANAYIVADTLPDIDQMTLGDKVNLLAALFIFLSLIISVFSLRLTYVDREEASRKLDFGSMVFLAVAWIVANTLVVII